MHAADAFPDLPLIRCICGVPNLTVTEFARHQAAALDAAGLLRDDCAHCHSAPPSGHICPACGLKAAS